VLQRYTLGFWDTEPNEDKENHVNSTKHIHGIATKRVSTLRFQAGFE
jgi:hypothetical protein